MSPPVHNAAALAIARRWLGTPYRHQASCERAGADCLGLIRGIWAELYASPSPIPPAYTADWAELSGEEPLLSAARCYLVEVNAPEPGDILLFRMRASGPAKHLGLLSGPAAMIHAYSGHGVVETPLTPPWLRRRMGSFRFPERPKTL
ncbi:MAG: NlpC/P60 family protein [Neomegalonema sp.]|nr:NlpC/P60 family protein [Neomegalonema sp.]